MRSHSNPPELPTEQELYAAALRALMRRAYSIHEMKEYLNRRAEDKDAVPKVIARLREQNYLNDERYAAEFARQRTQFRRQGRYRIARELRTRGVPDRFIDAALDSAFAETDEAALVRARLKRKLALARGPLDERKLSSLHASLLRAGFSSDVIRAELKRVTKDDVAELPDSADE